MIGDRIVEAVVRIAQKLGADLESSGNRLADGLEGIADSVAGGAGEPFVITFTPTEEDFSGTMDKTVAEITEAYNAGRTLVALVNNGDIVLKASLVQASSDVNSDWPSFDFVVWNTIDNLIIFVSTLYTNDGDKVTYGTSIYTLTPYSP